jgi:formylmethanofuran dehydrogenase subunit C
MTTLTLRRQPESPVDASILSPDALAFKSANEIGTMKLFHGKESALIREFFDIDGGDGAELAIHGDLSRFGNIASGMTQGRMKMHGNAGPRLGAGMRGGAIVVEGNVGDWAGAEMTGGTIHISGNAGDCLGGAGRGYLQGMNRGVIIVDGNVGNEIGTRMRRGLIVVAGSAGDFAGAFMTAGTIIVLGQLGKNTGAGLLRGTIIAGNAVALLPTFRYSCCGKFQFVRLLFHELNRFGLSSLVHYGDGVFRRYSGDFNRRGKGEVLIYDQR